MVYSVSQNEELLDIFTFDGVFADRDRIWHKRDEFFGQVIERYLILHRNHELRFVPEGVDEILEDTLGFIRDIQVEELFSISVSDINWWKELQHWKNIISNK
jgi:hypothetical protein